jgi:hypothetical protein
VIHDTHRVLTFGYPLLRHAKKKSGRVIGLWKDFEYLLVSKVRCGREHDVRVKVSKYLSRNRTQMQPRPARCTYDYLSSPSSKQLQAPFGDYPPAPLLPPEARVRKSLVPAVNQVR